jgi:hypothetical protein
MVRSDHGCESTLSMKKLMDVPQNRSIEIVFKSYIYLIFSKSRALMIKESVPTKPRPKESENKLPTKGYAQELFSVIIEISGTI